MPIPTPNSGDSEQQFVSRCMGNPNMQEYDAEQRAAICHAQWAKRKSLAVEGARLVLRLVKRSFGGRDG